MKSWRSVLWVGAACLMSHFGQKAWAQDCGAWVNRAPASGEVTCIGADSQTPGTLYAGTAHGGVFKSTDGGTTWAPTVLTDKNVRALVMDPLATGRLFVATDGDGVWKISDGGSSASSGNPYDFTTLHIHSIAMDPQNHSTLYAGGEGALFKSTDGEGFRWTQLPLSAGTVLALAVDPSSSSTVYAGMDGEGVFKSGDGGTTWGRSSSGLGDMAISAFAVDPGTPTTLYAGSRWNGIYKTADGGATWTPAGLTGTGITGLAFDSNSGTLYAATGSGGVFRSPDGGNTWLAMNTGLASLAVSSLALGSQTAPNLYAGGYNTVSACLSGGSDWSTSYVSNINVEAIAVDPQNPANLIAGTFSDGLLKSSDGGGTWNRANTGFVTPTFYSHDCLAIDPSNHATMYAASGYSVYKSTDGGSTWTPHAVTSSGELYVVAADPNNPSTLYTAGYHNGPYKSADGGMTWNPTALVYTNGGIVSMTVDSLSTLWVGDHWGALRFSKDGGTTWGGFAVSMFDVYGLAVAPSDPSTIYVTSSPPSGGEGILKTTDGGSTWSDLLLVGQNVLSIVIDPNDTSTLYAGTYAGVFRSTDGGGTWSPFSSGLSNLTVSGLAIDPKNSATLYAGTGQGYGSKGGAVAVLPLVPPEVASVTPAGGASEGGTVVTITGSHLLGTTGVMFGSIAAQFTVDSDTRITATSPPQSAGVVDIQAIVGTCASAMGEGDVFDYGGCSGITLEPAVLPEAGIHAPYSQTLLADGGIAPYSFSVASGTLPVGLSLSSGGLLSGTPTALSDYYFRVRATDQGGCIGTRDYALAVNCGVTVSPPVLPPGSVATAYNQTLTATGGTSPYGYVVTAGSLPPGLILAPYTGMLSGTPSNDGAFPFTVTVWDYTYCTTDKEYSLTIYPACTTLTLSPASLPGGTAGTAYAQSITAAGGTGPYTYAVTSGALPPGLTLAIGGQLAGTASEAGSFDFTVTATDAHECTGSRSYTVVVNSPCSHITLSPASLSRGVKGTPYAQTLNATGGTSPYGFQVTSGSPPAGLNLSAGILSGTPTAGGTYSFVVTATDSQQCTGSQDYQISICVPPSIMVQPQGAAILSGQTATLTVTAEGDAPLAYQWYRGSSGDTSNPVGTNAASFTTPALAQTTSYWVRVSNGCGTPADSAMTTIVVCTLSCMASASISSGEAPLLVTFMGSAVVTGGCAASIVYDWDFGDGSAHSGEQNPGHTYASSGNTTWTLTVTAGGLTCTKSGTIAVTAGCIYVLSSPSKNFTYKAGFVNVNVTASGQSSCGSPSINVNGAWITCTLLNYSNNKGKVKISVSQNPTASPRSAQVILGGSIFAVAQDGAPCKVTAVSPTKFTISAAGGDESIAVTATEGSCPWTASPNGAAASWITMSVASGSGPGTATFVVSPNTAGKKRTGTISVSAPAGKKTVTVAQSN